MSWSVAVIGKSKAAIKTHISVEDNARHIPHPVRSAIVSAVDALPDGKPISLTTNGHVDSENGTLTITLTAVNEVG